MNGPTSTHHFFIRKKIKVIGTIFILKAHDHYEKERKYMKRGRKSAIINCGVVVVVVDVAALGDAMHAQFSEQSNGGHDQ